MRITALVIFILCINLASAIIGSFGMFTTNNDDAATTQYLSDINDTVQTHNYLSGSVTGTSTLTGGGDFITGLFTFVGLFFTSLALPNKMLMAFGIPSTIAMWVTFPIYFLYLVALIQMISGRYVE